MAGRRGRDRRRHVGLALAGTELSFREEGFPKQQDKWARFGTANYGRRFGPMKGRYMMKFLVMVLGIVSAAGVPAMELYRPFAEVARDADCVFLGTVLEQNCRPGENGKMIFTDVSFGDLQEVTGKVSLDASEEKMVILSFAGGEFNGEIIKVSDVPEFTTGERYVLFIKNRSPLAASPLVGCTQGLFRLMRDTNSEQWYPLTYSGRGIAEFDDKGELVTTPPIGLIREGKATYRHAASSNRLGLVPERSASSPSKVSRASLSKEVDLQGEKLVTLSEFLKEIYVQRKTKGGEDR